MSAIETSFELECPAKQRTRKRDIELALEAHSESSNGITEKKIMFETWDVQIKDYFEECFKRFYLKTSFKFDPVHNDIMRISIFLVPINLNVYTKNFSLT